MANEPVRPRVTAFLARQDGYVHVGGIARGAQVSANSVRTVLRELEAAGRLEVRSAGDMPGPTGAGYRLRLADPARHHPQGAAPAGEEDTGDQLGGLYKTTVVLYTSRPVTGTGVAALIRAAHHGEAFSPTVPTRPALVPLPGNDPDWYEGRLARHVEKIPVRLLCDRCYEAVTGELTECQPGCLHGDIDGDGACLWPDGPTRCSRCGQADRLTPVPLDHHGLRKLPAAREHPTGSDS